MANPTCPKSACTGRSFNLQTYDLSNATPVLLLCCVNCGAVVGSPGVDISVARIDKIYRILKSVAQKIGVPVE